MVSAAPVVVVLALLVAVFALMAIAWRARARRGAALGEVPLVPSDPGALLGAFSGFYVATTEADRPLERLALRGLAFRSRAVVRVHASGAVIEIPGQDDVFIPAGRMTDYRTANWTIDRVVEDEGLQVIAWSVTGPAGRTAVESYFRVDDANGFARAIDSIRTATESEPS